jgi:hypothetical protein
MATAGLIREINGWIVTGASCSDHDCGSEEKEEKYVVMYVY